MEKQYSPLIDDSLTEVLRDGARKLLAEVIEMEVAIFIDACRQLRLEDGRQWVVRNGRSFTDHGAGRAATKGFAGAVKQLVAYRRREYD